MVNVLMISTEVKLLSKNCNFCNTADCFGSLLRDKIVYGIRCDKVREKLLSEKALTPDKVIENLSFFRKSTRWCI